jgi:hypothetical protein
MSQNTKYQHWCRLVEDAVPLKMSESAIVSLYHRTASAYALGNTYTFQIGMEIIDLTKIFEHCILLNILTAENK